MEISEGVMASADNTLLDLYNSSDDTQPHPIIVKQLLLLFYFLCIIILGEGGGGGGFNILRLGEH